MLVNRRDPRDYPPIPAGQSQARPVTGMVPLLHARYTDSGKRRLDRHFRKYYGITLDQYDALWTSQGGICAICRKAPNHGRPLHVDHCHSTGVVRGLLCMHCNRGVGGFMDNPDWCEAAARYLRCEI